MNGPSVRLAWALLVASSAQVLVFERLGPRHYSWCVCGVLVFQIYIFACLALWYVTKDSDWSWDTAWRSFDGGEMASIGRWVLPGCLDEVRDRMRLHEAMPVQTAAVVLMDS